MNSPIVGQLGANFTTVRAWGAASFIKQALLLDAEIGITHVMPNGQTRMLTHGAFLRSTAQLPWPLSMIQPHGVNYVLIDTHHNVNDSQEFNKSQIDDAISYFLSGLEPNAEVSISVN